MKKNGPEERRLTDEEMSRAAEAKLKRHIAKSAIELAEREPEVKRQMVGQTFGYDLPDQAQRKQRELIAHIDGLVIERLKEDDKLARAVVEGRLRQITEEMGLQIEGEQWQRKPRSIGDEIERVEEFNRLKEVLGVKEPGVLDAFKDPQVIVTALKFLSQLLDNRQAPRADDVVLLVSEDGKEREITRQEYEQLKAGDNTVKLEDAEIGESISPGSGGDAASESEASNEADEGDGETGATGSGS